MRLLTILTIILGLGLIVSCEDKIKTDEERYYPPKKSTQKETKTVQKQQLWGHWVCVDYIELVKARKTIRSLTNRPVFLEVVFNPAYGDSALLVTGYNKILTPYKRIGTDSILIKNKRTQTNLVLFASNGLQSLELKDSLVGEKDKSLHSWVFKKTSGIKKQKKSDLSKHINNSILSGTYTNAANQTINFIENGTINGWKLFNKYEVCTGGDCFMLTHSSLDIITLRQKDIKKQYAFWQKSNDSLYLYHLEKINDDFFYNYQPKEVAFAFKKIK